MRQTVPAILAVALLACGGSKPAAKSPSPSSSSSSSSSSGSAEQTSGATGGEQGAGVGQPECERIVAHALKIAAPDERARFEDPSFKSDFLKDCAARFSAKDVECAVGATTIHRMDQCFPRRPSPL